MSDRAAGGAATIVAVNAICHIASLAVIKMNLRPGGSDVAGFAELAGQHVVLRFAGGFHSVMALGASINDAFVIENPDIPGGGDVARSAVIVGPNVIERLAFGFLIVVARLARFAGLGVVEAYYRPTGCPVTILADL